MQFMTVLAFSAIVTIASISAAKPAAETSDARSIFGSLVWEKLDFVAKKIGVIECKGADGVTGGSLMKIVMGPNADFGGDYLCEPTCGGTCIPNKKISVAPISGYPFGCKCSKDRCDKNGPIIKPLARPIFKVVCAKDPRCTCEGVRSEEEKLPRTGYLCNWINLNLNKTVSYTEETEVGSSDLPPTLSPIRWCSCCPQV